MLRFKAFLTSLIAIALSISGFTQVYEPVSWSFVVNPVEPGVFDLEARATIEDKWHVYAAVVSDDPEAIGPIPTSVVFADHPAVQAEGKLREGTYITHFDPNFEMELNYFENTATFTQRFRVNSDDDLAVEAELSYMACDDSKCIFPDPEVVTMRFQNRQITAIDVNGELVFGDAFALPGGSEDSASGIYEPASWTMRSVQEGDNGYVLEFTCALDKGWHLYSQHLVADAGPVPTEFSYTLPEGHTLNGATIEPTPKVEYDPNFMMDLAFFEGAPIFTQRITIDGTPGVVSGEVLFMLCDDTMCLPPDVVEFSIDLATGLGGFVSLDAETGKDISTIIPSLDRMDLNAPAGNCGQIDTYDSNWAVFFFGFIGGLLALLTPCVFPMIPLTVSFFTKGGSDRSSGLGKAVLYGVFIFLIYAILSVPFHFGTDPEALNEIATSVTLNILFFIVFVVFAISFFGYFEITLPTGLLNKADSASNVGGVLGIFFMALTLALVSFSCTGPILGTVLGNSLKDGPWPISYAMSGFGIALGLPFALFAAFPSWLNNLPKSGGWLNSVKVVLGFLELGLALKFLSNADLVEQWGLIKRETFFLVWVVLGIGLTLYLFGLVRFPHDSPLKKLSMPRATLAVASLAFTVYIFPGMFPSSPWNHDLLAGFPPPTFYSWYERDTFHAEFDDFESGMAHAAERNKPVLLDFTGWACVNCRQMEETVWTDQEIKRILEEDFVLVSLYVDDKIELPLEKQGVFEFDADGKVKKKKIRTIGNKWATFQTHVFNNNSQPYYVMLSPNGELLGNPIGYTPDVDTYREYLRCGLRAFEQP
jgi:thiol:disulfide interchange protein DsbD